MNLKIINCFAKVGRIWIAVYLYAYSKGDGDDGLKVVTGEVKKSSVVEAGPVNSSK